MECGDVDRSGEVSGETVVTVVVGTLDMGRAEVRIKSKEARSAEIIDERLTLPADDGTEVEKWLLPPCEEEGSDEEGREEYEFRV